MLSFSWIFKGHRNLSRKWCQNLLAVLRSLLAFEKCWCFHSTRAIWHQSFQRLKREKPRHWRYLLVEKFILRHLFRYTFSLLHSSSPCQNGRPWVPVNFGIVLLLLLHYTPTWNICSWKNRKKVMFLKSWHTGIFVENPINMLLSLTFARGRVFPLWKQVNSGKNFTLHELFLAHAYFHVLLFFSYCTSRIN